MLVSWLAENILVLRPGAVFTLSGRASRAPFWFGIVCGGAAIFMVAAAILGTAMLIGVTSASVDLGLIAWSIDGRKVTFSGVLPLLVIVPVTVRRLHDRDRPAWWLLVFFGLPPLLPWVADRVAAQIEVLAVIVPEPLASLPDLVRVGLQPLASVASFGLSVWAFVELGLRHGTQGPNRFGPDPTDPARGPIEAASDGQG